MNIDAIDSSVKITTTLVGYIEGYLSVLHLRSGIPEDVRKKTKELSAKIRKEIGY